MASCGTTWIGISILSNLGCTTQTLGTAVLQSHGLNSIHPCSSGISGFNSHTSQLHWQFNATKRNVTPNLLWTFLRLYRLEAGVKDSACLQKTTLINLFILRHASHWICTHYQCPVSWLHGLNHWLSRWIVTQKWIAGPFLKGCGMCTWIRVLGPKQLRTTPYKWLIVLCYCLRITMC